MTNLTIYKDNAANAIFMHDSNGVQFLNSLSASVDDAGFVVITDTARNKKLIAGLEATEISDLNGQAYGSSAVDVCNALNAIFSNSGTSTSELPTITSSLTASIVEGESLNYELVANNGVGYEWDLSAVSGVSTVEGNIRKLVGGSSLSSGIYNIPVKAINYNGEDSETLVLTVSTPPFANTKSINFSNQDWLGANASLLENTLGRTGNGSGSGDAWTIGLWFKPSFNSSGQTIFYFGDADIANGGHFHLRFLGANDNLRFQYGSTNNYLRFHSANSSLTPSQWHHILVTYNGGTTGASSANMADYYSRFKVFIDGSNVISAGTWTHNNFGYTGGIDADNLRVGRYASGNYMKDNTRVDELAIWDSDQSANKDNIYNSGVPFDLSTLSAQPKHWWPVDGSIYPNMQDIGTQANCTFVMYNMTSADIVSDTP